MDLADAGLAQHPHQSPLGVAADDRVVHHDQPLPGDHLPQGLSLSRMPSCRMV